MIPSQTEPDSLTYDGFTISKKDFDAAFEAWQQARMETWPADDPRRQPYNDPDLAERVTLGLRRDFLCELSRQHAASIN